jgi:hypothetical protein
VALEVSEWRSLSETVGLVLGSVAKQREASKGSVSEKHEIRQD